MNRQYVTNLSVGDFYRQICGLELYFLMMKMKQIKLPENFSYKLILHLQKSYNMWHAANKNNGKSNTKNKSRS